MTDPRAWLGKGNQEVPGKPFGWAHHMERDAIRQHLRARGFDTSGHMGQARLEFRVTKIQQRLRRYEPTWAERQREWARNQRAQALIAPEPFTRDQLLAIRDRFAMDNSPEGQAIHLLAAAHARHLIGSP